ncbi:MAG: lysine biosynthesis protein LysX [Thaumarchaeota archaeon]|nr:MAG: lysine biosynthesis protein LysX [Nitrososphaerota archaeon]TLX94363.1 MAG: lysine biosynthesis protein LysX [Nitrososphaerota archaeon]
MPKVCIVFDRVRVEEKMLEEKAIELGHDTKMIDAKITQISTESKKNNFDFGDVVIERCVSYFRGLHFTACLEFLDVPVVNKFEVANNCGNKMLTSLLLKKHNVPTPKTYFAFSSEAALEILDKEGYPLVIKPVIGSWGRGVMPLKDRDTADAIVEVRELSDGPLDRIYYLQEMVKRPPRDIRAIAVGGNVIAAMYRTSRGFKTNIALGAEPISCEITKELEDLCIKASQAVGGGILGIDIMEDEKHGLVVHEINNTVEFKGLAKVAKRNIPKEMIEYAVTSAIR